MQMVFNFLNGGAGINVLARHAGAKVVVVDIGVKSEIAGAVIREHMGKGNFVSKKIIFGTKNMRHGPAMSRNEAVQCIQAGIDLAYDYAGQGYKIFATGEMGIGNTTPSSAIAAVLTGRPVSEVTGKGTGIEDETLKIKIGVIEDSIRANNPDPSDPIDVLSKVGGAEIGGIAGLIMGAALAMLMIEAGLKICREMATFDEAAVSGKSE